MPQWKKEIRRRVARLQLAPAREAEIVEELVQHLEDRYQELLLAGATQEEALSLALAELQGNDLEELQGSDLEERQGSDLEELQGSDLLARELRRVERRVEPEPIIAGANRRG